MRLLTGRYDGHAFQRAMSEFIIPRNISCGGNSALSGASKIFILKFKFLEKTNRRL